MVLKLGLIGLETVKEKKNVEIPSCFNHCPLQASLMTSRCILFMLLFWHHFQTTFGSVNIKKEREGEKKKKKKENLTVPSSLF